MAGLRRRIHRRLPHFRGPLHHRRPLRVQHLAVTAGVSRVGIAVILVNSASSTCRINLRPNRLSAVLLKVDLIMVIPDRDWPRLFLVVGEEELFLSVNFSAQFFFGGHISHVFCRKELAAIIEHGVFCNGGVRICA